MKPWWYYKVKIAAEIRCWVYWKFTGWPFKQRCPQCTGNGRYISEAEARYHDAEDTKCCMCAGTGRIKRQQARKMFRKMRWHNGSKRTTN